VIPYIRKNKKNQGSIGAGKLRGEIRQIRWGIGDVRARQGKDFGFG